MAYALTVAYLPNFSSPIAFTCMVHQNFPPPNISRVWYDMCPYTNILFTAPVVLKGLLQLALPEYSNILLRKLNIKLLQVSICVCMVLIFV